ncbi:MAG: histidine kinase, partial [Gammaproteobacteria bacterium]|nr:histidine kinase [Gammaproteobacteria bacterium]
MRHITRQMRAGWLLVLLLLVSVALPGHAREGQSTCTGGPIGVSEHLQRIDLTGCLSYLEDPEHNFTLEDVQAREREGALTAHTDGILNFGYTRSAYWVRFDLLYAGSTAQRDAVLELVLPLADEVTLYQITPDGGRIERHLRYDGDWRLREIAVPNPAFRVELQADVPSTFYLRIYSRNTLRIPLILWSTDSYPAKVAVDEAIQGLFLGSMLAIFAYNLFVTLAVRDRGYMLYSLYLLFATLFVFTEQVHGQQLFNGRPWFLDKELLHFHIWLAWFWGLHMARELLETRTRPQAWGLDHILRLATFAVVTSFVLSLVVDYHVAMHWTVMFSIFLAVLM